MKGFLELFNQHKIDLSKLYGEFAEYKSFDSIIQLEFERWSKTDSDQKTKLDKILKKSPKLTLNDWINAITTYGIAPDFIAQVSG